VTAPVLVAPSGPTVPGRGPAQGALYLVVVLAVANAVSYVDRQVLVLLIDSIKRDLSISDTQIGLLQGPAFALFYAVLGLFLGRLVDRAHRLRLLIGGMVVWSAMTVACGFANDFGTMFVCRTGVGVGEAVLTPAAASLIADRVDPEFRARAMSAFVGGQAVGAALALIGGGMLVAAVSALAGDDGRLHGLAPWQWVFVACGALAIPLVALVLPIREPERHEGAAGPANADAVARGTGRAWRELRPRLPALGGLILAFCLLGVVGWGAGSWLPTYFIRRFELGVGTVGATYGVIVLVCAPLGAMAGGWVTDRLRRRRPDAVVIVGLLGVAGLCSGVVATTQFDDVRLAWAAVCVYNFFSPFPFGSVYAALAEGTPNAYRGQAVAVYALGLNVFGFGLGPTTVGFANDRLFGAAGVGESLTLLAVVYGLLSAAAFLAVRRPFAEARVARGPVA
jgi:MFS family permease